MKAIFFTLIVLSLVSCKDDLPPGFYDHQITRLLAGGNAPDSMKTWVRTTYVVDGVKKPLEECTDSVRLLFKIIQTLPKDSVITYALTPKADCLSMDTLIVGGMRPSSTDDVFTDSLIFTGGALNYMIVEHITSVNLSVRYQQDGSSYRASYNTEHQDH